MAGLLNVVATGNPFFVTFLLEASTGRDLGGSKGVVASINNTCKIVGNVNHTFFSFADLVS